MNLTFWSSEGSFYLLFKNSGLITLLAGILMLSVLLAEGCVKRPDLEPTPGVSSKVLAPWAP